MALSKFTKDMGIIAKLEDEPNDVGGLTAAQLKEKFDEGGIALQDYINQTLTPQVDAELARIQEEKVGQEELNQVVLGQIPEGSIAPDKVTPDFFDNYYSKSDALTAQQVRAVCT